VEQEFGTGLASSGAHLKSLELKSSKAAKHSKYSQTRNVEESLSKGRQNVFTTLSGATSRVTPRSNVTFDRLETLFQKVKWNSSLGRKDIRHHDAVSFLSIGT
jgi:hypothetical protein